MPLNDETISNLRLESRVRAYGNNLPKPSDTSTVVFSHPLSFSDASCLIKQNGKAERKQNGTSSHKKTILLII